MAKIITSFTDAGRARFVEFLEEAFGPEFFRQRMSLSAAEVECLDVCEARLNAGETMSWEVAANQTPLRKTSIFRPAEDELVIREVEVD